MAKRIRIVKRMALVGCVDPRINQRPDGRDYVGAYIAWFGYDDCFRITRAGGVQDIVRPQVEGYRESIMRDIRVAVSHGIDFLELMNHELCAAYAHFEFKNRQIEIAQHKEDLLQAKGIILGGFPGLTIGTSFAELAPKTKDVFVISSFE